MINLIKKIMMVKKENEEKTWLIHIIAIPTIFFVSYFVKIDFVVIPRILSLCFFIFSAYFYLTFHNNPKYEKYFIICWIVLLYSVLFIGIELEEKGFDYFILIMILNIVLSLFCMNRKELKPINKDEVLNEDHFANSNEDGD